MINERENKMRELIKNARRRVEEEAFCMDDEVQWRIGVIPSGCHNQIDRIELDALIMFAEIKGYVIADFNIGIVVALGDEMQTLCRYRCYDFGDE